LPTIINNRFPPSINGPPEESKTPIKARLQTSITGFIFGDKDLSMKTTTVSDSWHGSQTLTSQVVGAGEISLADIVSEPSLAISTMTENFQRNILPMALGAFGISITFRVGRRLLRRPIASVNRNLIKPALGAGVRL